MTDLDKKIQKAQTDLAQSILEAYEKRNQERVDILISNAFKQLKISRFKPDQTTCISLIYLARICPKVFASSANTKDLLKSHIRRDNGPASIKGTKNDIILPILAANILLACCDDIEVRTIILNRIEQWCSSQKATEMVQHLLVVLCMKCQGDFKTIRTLIEMRQNWMVHVQENDDICSLIPTDLCASVRRLLFSETDLTSIIDIIQFLIKHDNIADLAREFSRFVIERPILVDSLIKQTESEGTFQVTALIIYNQLLKHLQTSPDNVASATNRKQTTAQTASSEPNEVVSKMECDDTDGVKRVKLEPKSDQEAVIKSDKLKSEQISVKSDVKSQANSTTEPAGDAPDSEAYQPPPIYTKFPQIGRVIPLDRLVIEAMFTLLIPIDPNQHDKRYELVKDLMSQVNDWLDKFQSSPTGILYQDICMTAPYQIPHRLRLRLVFSKNYRLVDIGLHSASTKQLLDLLHQFGLPLKTLNKILKKFVLIKDSDSIRAEIKDIAYFNQLMEFLTDMGADGSKELQDRMNMV